MRRTWWVAAVVAGTYLVVAFWLMPDYGPVWDIVAGEYPWGETWWHALANGETDVLATHDPIAIASRADRPPHPDFSPRVVAAFPWYQVWPLCAILSAASCRLFWDELGLLPALIAHNVPIVLVVAGLLATLVRWCAPRLGLVAGVSAAVLLLLTPGFFAHSFNNLKDVPETCFYAFALLASFSAWTTGRRWWWCCTGILLAVALAQKTNAIFIPVQLALFAAWAGLQSWRGRATGVVWAPGNACLGALVFVVTYLALFPPLWHDTWERLWILYRQIKLVGREDSWTIHPDGLVQFLVTTPPIVLALATWGACSRRLTPALRVFLILGVAVPVGRTLLPGMRNFDGVRHFLEFQPFLAILAGVGAAALLQGVTAVASRLAAPPAGAALGRGVALAAVFASVGAQTVATHPNGTCYFNVFIGGLAGARAHEVRDAGDYWGNSYWQGLDWLNRNAETGATLFVPLAEHIVAAAAPVKLRADLRLYDPAAPRSDKPIYVMFILRRHWETPLMVGLEQTRTPEHAILVQGAPILKVFKLEAGIEAASVLVAIGREPNQVRIRLQQWLDRNPAMLPTLIANVDAGWTPEVNIANVQRLLPAELQDSAAVIAGWMLNRKMVEAR